MRTKTITIDSIAVLLIALWFYAAYIKLRDYTDFYTQLKGSYLTSNFPLFLSIVIPVMELALIALILPLKTRKLGFALSAILLGAFTTYIIYILNFAPSVPCACGGIISGFHWKQHLIFNGVFLGLNVIGFAMVYKQSWGLRMRKHSSNVIDQNNDEKQTGNQFT